MQPTSTTCYISTDVFRPLVPHAFRLVLPELQPSSLSCSPPPWATVLLPERQSYSLRDSPPPWEAVLLPERQSYSLRDSPPPWDKVLYPERQSSSLSYSPSPWAAVLLPERQYTPLRIIKLIFFNLFLPLNPILFIYWTTTFILFCLCNFYSLPFFNCGEKFLFEAYG